MSNLTPDLSLSELQRYVSQCEIERGFAAQTSVEKCLLLGEEVGELFRAVRRSAGMLSDPTSRCADVAEELADILNYVLAIANRFEIDLDAAYAEKEEKNRLRTWR